MNNYPSDFESPFGKIVPHPAGGGSVIASCAFCFWLKRTDPNPRKHWSAASRARMGLQLHAIAKHASEALTIHLNSKRTNG